MSISWSPHAVQLSADQAWYWRDLAWHVVQPAIFHRDAVYWLFMHAWVGQEIRNFFSSYGQQLLIIQCMCIPPLVSKSQLWAYWFHIILQAIDDGSITAVQQHISRLESEGKSLQYLNKRCKDKYRETLVHFAVKCKHVEILKLLLDHKAGMYAIL